jgi:hypothetical protein
MKLSVMAIIAISAIPVLAHAGSPRCSSAGLSYQTCKVNPDTTAKYVLAAKAYGTALPNGVHWMDVVIKINGQECGSDRTKAWADGPGTIQTTCEVTLQKDKEHEIEGVSDNGNVQATKFELSVRPSSD